MVAFTTLFAGIAAAASIVAANPVPAPECTCDNSSNDEKFLISDFFSRKPDGTTISTLGFNISATTGGQLNFRCGPYDPATDSTTSTFEDGKVYFCGKNSLFSFSFANQENKLNLWHTIVANTNIVAGNAVIPNYCHAGGASPSDMVCQGVANVTMTLVKTG